MGKPIRDYEVTEIGFTKVDNAVNGMAWNKYGQVIAKATAKCHPEDKFDFSYGEALCNTRLIQEIARVKKQAKFRAVRCLEDNYIDLTKGKIYYIENDKVIGNSGMPAYNTKAYGFKELFEPITSIEELLIEGMWGVVSLPDYNCYNLFCILSDGSVIFDDGGFSAVPRFSSVCSDAKILALFKSTTAGGFNKRKNDIIYHYNSIKFYYGDFDALEPYIEQKKKEDEL
jgi:hypothetical protein